MYENPPKPNAPPAEDVLERFDYILAFGKMIKDVLKYSSTILYYFIIFTLLISFVAVQILIGIFFVNGMCASSKEMSKWDQCIAIDDVSLGHLQFDGNTLSTAFQLIVVQPLKFWYNDLSGKMTCDWVVPLTQRTVKTPI